MDLTKMDPMARKLDVHTTAFQKAIEDGNADEARMQLSEIVKYAEYLNTDLDEVFRKQEKVEEVGLNQFVNGVPVFKANKSGQNFDVSQRDDVLPGFIPAARSHGQIRQSRGTFGRYVE